MNVALCRSSSFSRRSTSFSRMSSAVLGGLWKLAADLLMLSNPTGLNESAARQPDQLCDTYVHVM